MPHDILQALEDNQIDNVISFLSKNQSFVNQVLTQSGDTPLMIAASLGYEALCLKLIKLGAKLSIQNRSGETALSLAIESGNQALVKSILTRYPEMIEARINAKQDTALMKVAQKGYASLVSWLLEKNASVLAQNRLGQYPAQFAENADIAQLIQDYTPKTIGALSLLRLLKNIWESLKTSCVKGEGELLALKQSIINAVDSLFNVLHQQDVLDESALIDVALILNDLLDSLQSDNKPQLQTTLMQLFDARSVLVKGSTFDFNYRTVAINQCLYEIVDKVWFEEIHQGELTHNQVLFHGTLTHFEGKLHPWLPFDSNYDPFLDTEIPPPMLPDTNAFFRDKKGRIHEIKPFIHAAINQLLKGEIKPEDIWIGVDERECRRTPVSDKELEQLSLRSLSFKKLVDYVNKRYQTYRVSGIRLTFQLLRDGLLKGDRTHGGSNEYAGADAAEAQVAFIDWWQTLGRTNPALQQRILLYRSWDTKQEKWISLKEVIDPLLDASKEAERSSDIFCIETMGQRLDVLLSDKKIQDMMAADSQLSLTEWDEATLTHCGESILKELSERSTAAVEIVREGLFQNTANLFVWLYLSHQSAHPFGYSKLLEIEQLSQKPGDAFECAIALLNDAPELLEKDKGKVGDLAIQKDFLPFILANSRVLSDDEIFSLSYASLKIYLKQQVLQEKHVSRDIISHSLKTALKENDIDWVLYLLRHELVDHTVSLDCHDKRYSPLKAGTVLKFKSSAYEGIAYTIINRQGTQLLLKFGESGPEDDIEISLTNREKVADITYYGHSVHDYLSLQEKTLQVNYATYALIAESLTLFKFATKEKDLRSDLTHLVDPKTGLFQNELFAREILSYLAKAKPFELSRQEIECLFNAVVLSQQFELLKPLIILGLSPDKVIDYRPYQQRDMMVKEHYLVNYDGIWIDCYVKQLNEKKGVTRALLEPIDNEDDSGLLPKWLTLNDDQDRAKIIKKWDASYTLSLINGFKINDRCLVNYYGRWVVCEIKQLHQHGELFSVLVEPTGRPSHAKWLTLNNPRDLGAISLPNRFYPLNQRIVLPKKRVLPFSFEQNLFSVWSYLIENKIARDDSLLCDKSATREKQIRYINALTEANLTLSKGCTDFLLNAIQLNLQSEQNLLVALALNDPNKLKASLNKIINSPLMEWAFRYESHPMLPILMSWHESLPDDCFDWVNTMRPEMLSAFLMGLAQNQSFYEASLDEKHFFVLFSSALKHRLLMKHQYFFEHGFQSGLLNVRTVIENVDRLGISQNEHIQMLVTFFESIYPISKVSQSALAYAQTDEKKSRIKVRLSKMKALDADNYKLRLQLLDAMINQFIRHPYTYMLLTAQTLEKLILLLDNDPIDEGQSMAIELIHYAMKYHPNITAVYPLLTKLDPVTQENMRYDALNEALKTSSVQQFKNSIADPQRFIADFLKTYQALYSTQSFFKSTHHWGRRKPTLEDIFIFSMHKPDSRTARALSIICQAGKGFHDKADEHEKAVLFNLIHKQSRAQCWLSRTNLCPEKDRTFDYVTQYAKTHPSSRTAQIYESLEWQTPYKR